MPADEFMRLALYDREHGYYHRADGQIGRAGDFITSVSVGSLFGELLGWEFLRRVESLAATGPWRIVESGAHDGRFAADLLGWLTTRAGEGPSVEYVIVEPSPARVAAVDSTRRREAVAAASPVPAPAVPKATLAGTPAQPTPAPVVSGRVSSERELRPSASSASAPVASTRACSTACQSMG